MKKHFFYLTYMFALAATLPANADNVAARAKPTDKRNKP